MIITTTFYSSSNGDRWQMLHNDENGIYQVRHEPNIGSGGQVSDVPLAEFLSRSGATPQGLALQQLLEKQGAIDPDLDA